MRSTVAAALCGVLLVAGCGPADAPEAESTGWRAAADSPLSPREQALGLWTGREVLLIGGSDAPPCPPNASCAQDPTPPTDGAAFDPEANRWRPLATPPVSLLGAHGVVLGSVAYVLPYASELVTYRIDRDTWARQPVPFDPRTGYQLLAAGDRLVAYLPSDEVGPGQDYLLDPRTATWTALPPDPLGAAFDRGMAWTGRELMLFDHALIPNPGAEGPTLTRMAALNLDTRKWRRLPDAPMLSTHPWLTAGGTLVNPTLGGADGGQVGNWGRTYPNGGRVDPATGAWSALPDPPPGEAVGAGARTGTTAVYTGLADHVLDTTTGTWQAVPALPGGDTRGHTVVAAGIRMLVFGGARPRLSQDSAELLNTTWLWTPG